MASNLFSAGLLAQSAAQTNWLTPVWLFSLGISIGFALALLTLVKIAIGRRIPGLNQIYDNLASRLIAGIGLATVYLGIFLGFSFWYAGPFDFLKHLHVLVCVLVPISLIIGFGAWALISKRQIGETNSVFFVFAVGGYFLSQANGLGVLNPVDSPDTLIHSLTRLPYAGTIEKTFAIPPTTEGKPHAIPISFDGSELKNVAYQSNKKVLLMVDETPTDASSIMDLPAAQDLTRIYQGGVSAGLFPETEINELYAVNPSDSDAELKLFVQTGPIYSEVVIVPILAIGTLGIYVLFLCLSTLFPKVFAIAHSTFKTEFSQPVYFCGNRRTNRADGSVKTGWQTPVYLRKILRHLIGVGTIFYRLRILADDLGRLQTDLRFPRVIQRISRMGGVLPRISTPAAGIIPVLLRGRFVRGDQCGDFNPHGNLA